MISHESLPVGNGAAAAMFCFLDWGEQEEASDVRLLDYHEAHSTAFDGLLCDNWHHYTDRVTSADLQAHTRHTVTV